MNVGDLTEWECVPNSFCVDVLYFLILHAQHREKYSGKRVWSCPVPLGNCCLPGSMVCLLRCSGCLSVGKSFSFCFIYISRLLLRMWNLCSYVSIRADNSIGVWCTECVAHHCIFTESMKSLTLYEKGPSGYIYRYICIERVHWIRVWSAECIVHDCIFTESMKNLILNEDTPSGYI